jgi:hypothetical protein
MARGWLFARVGTSAKNAFPFMGARCDRVVHSVFARLEELCSHRLQIQRRFSSRVTRVHSEVVVRHGRSAVNSTLRVSGEERKR